MSRNDDLERIFFQAVFAADERLRCGEYPGGESTNLHDEAMKYAGERYTAMQAAFDERDQLRKINKIFEEQIADDANVYAERDRLEKAVEWARKVDGNLYEAHKIEGTEALNGLHDALDALKEG